MYEAHHLISRNIDLRVIAHDRAEAAEARGLARDHALRERGLDPADPRTHQWLLEYRRCKRGLWGAQRDYGRFNGGPEH